MTPTEQPATPRRAGIEGRVQTRFRCHERKFLRFAIRPTFQNHYALINDVSVNGIGFVFDKHLEPGTVLALQLRGGRQGTSMVRTARVMHIRRHLPIPDAPWVRKKPWLKSLLTFFTNGQENLEYVYLVGCRFSPPLSPEELEDLCGAP